MAGSPQPSMPSTPRYWAFISYSHRDKRWGEWLHRSLETYRVPKALVASGAPARVFPVFRDREELAGAINLTTKIEEALADSRNLIVVCSPRSAASRWVDEEIRRYARLGRADRIFALIVDGEPHAQIAEQECLPAALRFKLMADGQPGTEPADYLAADARQEGDGKKNALLKLTAGLIDVDYDKLKRRDHERQMRARATWIGALAALLVIFAAIAGYAVLQRNQAVRSAKAETEQRKIAEERERVAVSRQLATEALNQMGTRVDLALLMAVEARRPARTFEASSSLLKVLQSQSGLVTLLHGHVGPVTQVAFSPDGKTIASGGMDSTVRLWSADGQALMPGPLYRHKGPAGSQNDVRALAFSNDNRLVASGSMNGTLRFGDVVNRRVLEPESQLGGTVSVLTFAPNGHVLVGSIGLNTADLIADKIVGDAFAVGGSGHFMPNAGAISPDGTIVAATKMTYPDEGLYLFDASSRKPISDRIAEKFPSIEVMRFSPDGALLAAGDREGSLRVWDVKTRRPLGSPIGGDGIVLALAFDADGERLTWVRSDGSVRVVRLKDWAPTAPPMFVGAARSAAFSPDRSTLVLGGNDGTVRIWDLRTTRHALGRGIGTCCGLAAVAVSPDGTYAALGGDFVELWDLQSGNKLRVLEGVEVESLAFSKGGERLAFAGELGAGYYELPSGNQVIVPSAERYPHNWGVAITPDGRMLAFGGKRLTLWDTVSKTERPAPQPGKGSVRAVAMTPDGATLAAGADDGTVHIIDLATLKASGSAFAFGEQAWALTFSPDGKVLAAGGDDGRLQLWDVAARQPIGAPLAGHTSRIRSIAFNPDGSLMAAVGSNRIAIIYDVATRRPLADPLFAATEYGAIAGAAFTPDGQRLLLVDPEQQLFILDGGLDAWAARACRAANRNLTTEEWSRYFGDQPFSATCAEPAK